jgi:serine/threonine protein kinase
MIEKLGKYEIVEKIGMGGFGTVYRGRDPFIKRTVAIKTCQSDDEEIKKRFFREAELAGNLHHRNITTIYDFGIQDGVPYIVQEYLTGEDLDKVIKRGEGIPLPRKIQILMDVCEGLAYAHSAGIIHRDMKPSNIRILEDGTVKIMDFGIAKSFQSESTLTQTGITLGTAAYLAPEQIRGEAVDPRTDIFSLGVLAYELLLYQKPFRGEHISTVLFKILNEQPEGLSQPGLDLPPALEAAVLKAMEKTVEKRYDSVLQFRQELAAVGKDFHAGDTTGKTVASASLPAPRPAESGEAGSGVTPPSGALARSPSVPPADATPTPRSGAVSASKNISLELVEFREQESPAPSMEPLSAPSRGTSWGPAIAIVAVLGAAAAGGLYYWNHRAAVSQPPSTRAAEAAPKPPVTTPPPAPPEAASPASPTGPEAAPAEEAQKEAEKVKKPEPPPPPKKFAVQFSSQPGATLIVDGKRIGESVPAKRIELEAGEHEARFVMADGTSFEQKFTAGRDGASNVFHAFRVGSLSVSSGSGWDGAQILIDGKLRATLPLPGVLYAPPGAHQLEITKPGVVPLSKQILIELGKTLTVPLPPPGAAP